MGLFDLDGHVAVVGDEQQVIDAMSEIAERHGRLDSCSANAGFVKKVMPRMPMRRSEPPHDLTAAAEPKMVASASQLCR